MKKTNIIIEAEGKPEEGYYAQSANTLFNFMEEPEFLETALFKKALIPRYYVEDVRFLNLQADENRYDYIAVLQKCFCDIQLSKLFADLYVNCNGKDYESLSDKDKQKALSKNTHPDFYGKYAIAFSKEWGIEHKLQPINYLNKNGQAARSLSKVFTYLMRRKRLPSNLMEDLLSRFAYTKPVQGTMEKVFFDENNKKKTLLYNKVFHDEKEWRYVPDVRLMNKHRLEIVLANPQAIDERDSWNKNLQDEKYKDLWLDFNYEDIKYLLVPDNDSRDRLIKYIVSLPSDKFDLEEGIKKQIIISKILVLDNIKEDI